MKTRNRTGALRRMSFSLIGLVAVLSIGGAQAAWQVSDQTAQNYLKSIDKRLGEGDVNNQLNKIYDAYRLGSAGTAGSIAAEPTAKEKLDHSSPSTATVSTDERCPSAKGGLSTLQRQVCEELMDTEKARYAYSLRMYDLAKTRMDRLDEIEKERSKIGDHEYGKLQDNSNKLLALMSLIQIDAQRHRTYMDAYAARIAYLAGVRDTLTRQALQGSRSPSIGSMGSAVVGGGALAMALEAQKSRTRYHFDGKDVGDQ